MRSSHPGKASWLIVMLLAPRAIAAAEPDPAGVERPDVAQFAQVCIMNTTGVQVQYELQWGGGPWESFSLSPAPSAREASSRTHYDRVSGSAAAREVRVRFDADMTDGKRTFEYRLYTKVAAEPRCEVARRYRFERDGSSSRYIDLRSVD
ncbi:hypothetical protein BE21_04090 [Sorangium cellulosum]|uniref:Secreted protein n=1 Tax=Sorangium cellulosum TaxID=56 RepID=A0A150THR7_SORCE|nr:hypothetical protein BE21_04090 [Sorangium cellulosum]